MCFVNTHLVIAIKQPQSFLLFFDAMSDEHVATSTKQVACAAAEIDALLDVIKHQDDHELLLEACNALCNVTSNVENAHRCCHAGEIVVDFIRRKRQVSDEMMQLACEVLANITVHADSQRTCGEAGGVEVAVEIIKQSKRPELLLQACLALRNMTMLRESEHYSKNQLKCGRAGGIEALVRLLCDPSSTTKLLEAICKALCTTCYYICGGSSTDGSLEGLLKIINKYNDVPASLIEWATAALWTIVEPNCLAQAKCVAIGGVKVLASVIQHNVDVDGSVKMLTDACGALRSCTQKSFTLILNSSIQKSWTNTLKVLCESTDAVSPIRALVSVLGRHLDTAPHELLTEACKAFSNIINALYNVNVSLGRMAGVDEMLGQLVRLVASRMNDAPVKVLSAACEDMSIIIRSNKKDYDNANTVFGLCGGIEALLAFANYLGPLAASAPAKYDRNELTMTHRDTLIKVCDLLRDAANNAGNRHRFDEAQGGASMRQLLTIVASQDISHSDCTVMNNPKLRFAIEEVLKAMAGQFRLGCWYDQIKDGGRFC